jgi:hypothetical protein
MNAWIRGLHVVMTVLSVVASIGAFTMLLLVLWNRPRIEERVRTRPPTQLSRKQRWIMISTGPPLLLAFQFLILPHFGVPLPLHWQILLAVVVPGGYVLLMLSFLSLVARQRAQSVAARIRGFYIALATSCFLALLSLYFAFR